MPDSKHTPIQLMHMTRRNCPRDRATRIAKRPRQLADGNDAVLPIRKLSQGSMRLRQSFGTHTVLKDCRKRFRPPVTAALLAKGLVI